MRAASGWRRIASSAAVAGAFVLALHRLAEACSFGFNPHQLDEAEKAVDTTPPGTPVVGPISITRGHGPARSGCSSTASSCDDIGAITFTLSATDDRTPAEKMGFRLTARRPATLEGFFPVGMDVRLFEGLMAVRWLDGATNDQESLDFELEVRAIDLAGNVSTEPAIIKVHQDTGGCSFGRGSTQSGDRPGVVVFGLAALLMVVRRRRRRRSGAAVRAP